MGEGQADVKRRPMSAVAADDHDGGGEESPPKGRPAPMGKSWTSPINVIRFLVILDMLGVAVVVPLLGSYVRDLHISTQQFGWVSSFYSFAQILGGLLLGGLSDRSFSRRSMLVLSFVGSGVSYGMVGFTQTFTGLLLGRVLVGLTKQTMTLATAFVTDHSDKDGRGSEIGRLNAASTFSFIVGPALGSFFYTRNKMLPPLVSAFLFLLAATLALALLPGHGKLKPPEQKSGGDGPKGLVENLKFTCRSRACLSIVAFRLTYGFMIRSLSASNFVGYFEERFNVESYILGYISSYRALLTLFAQVYLVGRLHKFISDRALVSAAVAALVLANLVEASPDIGLWAYLATAVPGSVLAHSLLGICLETIFTLRIPKSDIGAALGTLNVLQSAAGVLAPLYGGQLFQLLGLGSRPLAAAVHYAFLWLLWASLEGLQGRGGSGGSCCDGDDDGNKMKENGPRVAGRTKSD